MWFSVLFKNTLEVCNISVKTSNFNTHLNKSIFNINRRESAILNTKKRRDPLFIQKSADLFFHYVRRFCTFCFNLREIVADEFASFNNNQHRSVCTPKAEIQATTQASSYNWLPPQQELNCAFYINNIYFLRRTNSSNLLTYLKKATAAECNTKRYLTRDKFFPNQFCMLVSNTAKNNFMSEALFLVGFSGSSVEHKKSAPVRATPSRRRIPSPERNAIHSRRVSEL